MKKERAIHLLEKPFQDNLPEFQMSLTKRRVTKFWREEKAKVLRQLYKDDVHDDKQFLPYVVRLFEKIRPQLLHAFSEEYPNQQPTIKTMEQWIQDCAISANVTDQIRERNTWTDIWKIYSMLVEDELIKVDQNHHIM